MTTFIPAAEAGAGFAARPSAAKRANASVKMVSRTDHVADARWAPVLGTGKILASSPPEHHAATRDDGGWCRRRQMRLTSMVIFGRRAEDATDPGVDRRTDPGDQGTPEL
jgi:hypothetical protein